MWVCAAASVLGLCGLVLYSLDTAHTRPFGLLAAAALISLALPMLQANFRMAMLCEWAGAPAEALVHYRRALDDPGGVSRAMVKLVGAQIDRIGK